MTTLLESAVDVVLDRTVVGGYSKLGYDIRQRWWDDADVQRLDGRTVAITGATAGLGRAAASGIAALGARVLLLVRSVERGEAARAEIVAETGHDDVSVVECDLSDLGSVRRCATALNADDGRVHVLVNNAGAMPAERTRSVDGIELTFATNVVGPFLLTNLLIPALERAAPARVINVSSGGMYGQRIHVEDLEMTREEYDGVTAYARSKRAQVILTELWAQQLRPAGIFVHAMHPGWADTPGVRTSLPRFYRVTRPLLRSPAQGADTILWLASAQLPGVITGGFWHDRRRRPTHVLPRTRETEAERALLWRACTEFSGRGEDRPDAIAPPTEEI